MTKILYDIFEKTWVKPGGTVWIYTDPHFGDLDCYKYFRFPDLFSIEQLNRQLAHNNRVLAADCKIDFTNIINQLDEMQIKNINSKCGKNDTLIILGDIGNIECIKKLKAAYKVLITGNHDAGKTNYERQIEIRKIKFSLTQEQKETRYKIFTDSGTIFGPGDWATIQHEQEEYTYKCMIEHFKSLGIQDARVVRNAKNEIFTDYDSDTDTWYYFIEIDNKLFDEVYTGKLTVSDKITLSHEESREEFALNIHGHNHSGKKGYYELDGFKYFNACPEGNNYYPYQLGQIVKAGYLHDIPNIHRETIDNAIERKLTKKK